MKRNMVEEMIRFKLSVKITQGVLRVAMRKYHGTEKDLTKAMRINKRQLKMMLAGKKRMNLWELDNIGKMVRHSGVCLEIEAIAMGLPHKGTILRDLYDSCLHN